MGTGTPSEHQAALPCCAVPKHWHRLPRGCGVSSLEVSRSCLDVGLGTLLWVAITGAGVGPDGPKGLCQPQTFWDLLTQLKDIQTYRLGTEEEMALLSAAEV